jgi:hypothetical protein
VPVLVATARDAVGDRGGWTRVPTRLHVKPYDTDDCWPR